MRASAIATIWAALAATALASAGCTDVGDSSAVPCVGCGTDAQAPGDDGAPGAGDDSSSATPDASGSLGDGSPAAGGEDAAGVDSTVDASTAGDDSGSVDTGVTDTSVADSAPADAAVDGGDAVAEAGFDAGHDAGALDASLGDAGSADAGLSDAGTVDAGAQDAAAEQDAPSALAPCTSPSQTGCVQCQGNADGVCTSTEAALVAKDIRSGIATAPGPDPAAGCYSCLLAGFGIDDPSVGVTGEECDDLSSAADKTSCLATLSCVLGTGCDSSGVISTCYCGTAPVSGACLTGGANGQCAAQEAAGLGLPVSDGTDVLKNYGATTLPSGVANDIFVSAASNSCSACYQ